MIIKRINRERVPAYLMAAAAVALAAALILHPSEAFDAAVKGLEVWWNVVFPALLPFFIGSEILMGLGVVHYLGVLLEPLMRPAFNVPGVGSFVIAMGLASGFLVGGNISTQMRRKKLITKVEAERLISFTNTSDPLFMCGAVALGMLGRPDLGGTIVAVHYLSALTTGLYLRHYGRNQPNTPETRERGHMLSRAATALYEARKKDGRAFGQLMGDAIRNSVNSLLLIGGTIILFSVLIRILTATGVAGAISAVAYKIMFGPLGMHPELMPAVINGFFEIDLGCLAASQVSDAVPLIQKIMATSGIIAWSGLSVFAQIAAITSDTDIQMKPFVIGRVIHAFFAVLYTWLFMGPLAPVMSRTMPVFSRLYQADGMTVLQRLGYMSRLFMLLAVGLCLLGVLLNIYKGIKIAVFRR
ncbi:MAG: sporulation integral membrane protein YlbJ [Firmicutes bacterium]|nr:sporulation integral membrane protein YlbJ [Bacillota bacterium]